MISGLLYDGSLLDFVQFREVFLEEFVTLLRDFALKLGDLLRKGDSKANVMLMPGDVIITGTPAGVGWSRKPQWFMKPGDVVVCANDSFTSTAVFGDLATAVQNSLQSRACYDRCHCKAQLVAGATELTTCICLLYQPQFVN